MKCFFCKKINYKIFTMANVLKPELVWIEGRCYRANDAVTDIAALQEHDMYENEVHYNENDDDEDDDNDDTFEVTALDNSRYAGYLHVSKHYIGSIIGKKGVMKMRIERDTKTNIKIPRQSETGDICILGPTVANVKAARRRINMIVMSSRMKQRPTHFISIPLNKPNIMSNFEIFKQNILNECTSRGLEESIFIRAEKLHLTMGVMCLMDNEERLLASKLLTDAKDKFIMPMLQNHPPLKVRVKGLSYMNDDPSQIDVLYSRVVEEEGTTGLLQNLADSIVSHYYGAGYMDREHGRDNVKLHVTLINTKYRSKSSTDDNSQKNSRRRETFDGTEILQKYGDFDFGVMDITEIHLSQRHTMSPDGYYQPTCIITCRA